jgi:hypothetical protein
MPNPREKKVEPKSCTTAPSFASAWIVRGHQDPVRQGQLAVDHPRRVAQGVVHVGRVGIAHELQVGCVEDVGVEGKRLGAMALEVEVGDRHGSLLSR